MLFLLCLSAFALTSASASTVEPSDLTTPTPAADTKCYFSKDYTAVCPVHLNSRNGSFHIIAAVKTCLSPLSVAVSVKVGSGIVWEHVFINKEESQAISAFQPDYVTLSCQIAFNQSSRLLQFTVSIREDNLYDIILDDSIFISHNHCTAHLSSLIIAVLCFTSILFVFLLIASMCIIYYRRKRSFSPPLNDLYSHQEEPLDQDAVELGQSRCNTTVVKNVIFRGHCIGSPPEDSELPMIEEENDEYANWFAYENCSASGTDRKKKRKSRPKPKPQSPQPGPATAPVIARPDALDPEVHRWSYLPQTQS